MAIHTLENDFLRVQVAEHGAELQSIYNKVNAVEYLWQGDAKIWGRRAPVLFPIVGRLYNDEYLYNNTSYKMSQHGFARDQHFDLLISGENQVTFLLTESPETLVKYPFNFNLYISYVLVGSKLEITYEVQNTNESEMFFSIGGHPAFNTINEYEDYIIEFEKDNYATFPLKGNYQSGTIQKVDYVNKILNISKELFQNDAIIFKNNEIKSVLLKHLKNKTGVKFSTNMPCFGIWTPKNTQSFVCLEPWDGIADYEKSTELKDKEYIIKLNKNQIHASYYQIEVF